MSKAIDPELHRRIWAMAIEGFSTSEIAQTVGLKKTAVLKYRNIEPDIDLASPSGGRILTQLRQLQSKYKKILEERVLNQRYEDFIASVEARAADSPIPNWTREPAKQGNRIGIPTAFLSDTHFDEVIDPAQIEYLNGYDEAIARARLIRFFEKTDEVCHHYWSGISYPGIVLPMGGDMFSGFIHDELAHTNASFVTESIIKWMEPIGQGIKFLADKFGNVFVPVCVGNHPRMSYKPRMKGRVRDNFDWLFGNLLAREFSKDPEYADRVTFQVAEAADVKWRVYNTRYLMSHGDQARGGSGVAGPLTPLAMLSARKAKRAIRTGAPHDVFLAAHWHQLMYFRDMVINGCFEAGTLIQTKEGVRPIQDIRTGDRVISRDGSIQSVTNVFEKQSGEGIVVLKVRGLPEALRVTPNHLIWALKGESMTESMSPKWRGHKAGGDSPQWIPAEYISPGDFVQVPRHVGTAEVFSEDLAWAYGMYLAEGHSLIAAGASRRHHRIEFSLHIKEMPVVKRLKGILDQHFGLEGRVWERSNKTTCHLSYSGEEVAVNFRTMFGHKAIGKKMPESFFDLSPNLSKALVQGWIDGDGHVRKDGVTCATTISAELAYGMFRLALSAGMCPSMAALLPGGKRKNTSYTIHFNTGQESREVNGELFYRVHHRFRNKNVVPVFDLEVSGEHTYTAGLVGVHNSLKGYDEYAYLNNFEFEEPKQALWITDPKHGICFTTHIRVTGPNEPWMKKPVGGKRGKKEPGFDVGHED